MHIASVQVAFLVCGSTFGLLTSTRLLAAKCFLRYTRFLAHGRFLGRFLDHSRFPHRSRLLARGRFLPHTRLPRFSSSASLSSDLMQACPAQIYGSGAVDILTRLMASARHCSMHTPFRTMPTQYSITAVKAAHNR